jgi:hypothetical protein
MKLGIFRGRMRFWMVRSGRNKGLFRVGQNQSDLAYKFVSLKNLSSTWFRQMMLMRADDAVTSALAVPSSYKSLVYMVGCYARWER